MGYTPEHKQQTRERILESARSLWKEKGYANVSINQIMKDAGLTHGGFYAHFKSKEDLFAEAALDTGMLERYREMIADTDVSQVGVLEMLLDFYLSTEHRDNPADGCPLVALSEDAWRLGDGVQAAYTKLTDLAVKRLAHILDGDAAFARMVLSAMIGAVQLARGTKDAKMSQSILTDTKAYLLDYAARKLD